MSPFQNVAGNSAATSLSVPPARWQSPNIAESEDNLTRAIEDVKVSLQNYQGAFTSPEMAAFLDVFPGIPTP
jgi:hypothetical protein